MSWPILDELQRRIEDLATAVARLGSRLAQAEQSTNKVWQAQSGGGGGGGAGIYCAFGLSIAAGTAPPGGSPASGTGDVYAIVGGAYSGVGTGLTVYNALQDATDATKTQLLAPNGDGSYTVIAESCT